MLFECQRLLNRLNQLICRQCGKSSLGRTVLQLLKPTNGSVQLEGRELVGLRGNELRAARKDFQMIFQDPMTSLNPVKRVGEQIAESLRVHMNRSRSEAMAEAGDLLEQVGIPEPAKRLRQYPHELSGGLRQRVVIAIALACGPRLLIADEPTTALDVTVQKHILDLLDDLRKERGMSMILITHDLGVVKGRTDEIMVMYRGRTMPPSSKTSLFQEGGGKGTFQTIKEALTSDLITRD
mgnify:CR=1 FL=1